MFFVVWLLCVLWNVAFDYLRVQCSILLVEVWVVCEVVELCVCERFVDLCAVLVVLLVD